MIFLSKAYQFCSSLREDRVFSAEVAMSHSSCILSFVLIDENQNERFYVTEIVFAAHIRSPFFRRERSNDVKYICGSQASVVGTVTKIKINPLSFKHLLSIKLPLFNPYD